MKRRIHLVPFTVTIPPEQRDHDLPEKLKAEWPGILAWMIRGCLEWQRQGLNPPAAVRAATEEYMANEDVFERWRAECIEPNPNYWEPSAALWKSWKDWADNAGEFAGKSRSFTTVLTERLLFVAERRGKDGIRGYRGGRIRRIDCPGGALVGLN